MDGIQQDRTAQDSEAMPLANTLIGNSELLTLDLTTMAGRLTDQQLAQVSAIANMPVPPPEPCTERHFKQCLRIMDAALPKRAMTATDAKLLTATYWRMLGHHPKDAISFLSAKAIERCDWFPTVKECMAILAEWRRVDEAVKRQGLARHLAHVEREARRSDREQPFAYLTQADVDAMAPETLELGLSIGALEQCPDGSFVPAGRARHEAG